VDKAGHQRIQALVLHNL